MSESGESQSAQKPWPYASLVVCLIWAFLTLSIFTMTLDGRHKNYARGNAQIAILAVVAARISLAASRREKNLVWRFYFWGLVLAAPLWLVIVEPLWHLLAPIYNDLTRTHP